MRQEAKRVFKTIADHNTTVRAYKIGHGSYCFKMSSKVGKTECFSNSSRAYDEYQNHDGDEVEKFISLYTNCEEFREAIKEDIYNVEYQQYPIIQEYPIQ